MIIVMVMRCFDLQRDESYERTANYGTVLVTSKLRSCLSFAANVEGMSFSQTGFIPTRACAPKDELRPISPTAIAKTMILYSLDYCSQYRVRAVIHFSANNQKQAPFRAAAIYSASVPLVCECLCVWC